MTAVPDLALNPGAYQLALHQATFRASVAAGTARPLVVPFSLAGPFLLPIAYLCIPHTRRPWLYRARYAVLALMVYLNARIVLDGTSSTNMAAAYATGLMTAWGVIWGATLLLWLRPQFDAARVEKRRKEHGVGSNGAVSNGNGTQKLPGPRVEVEQHGPVLVDESVTAALRDGYEYYWQSYPEDGTFLERLDWVFDLTIAFRGSGWNWAIDSIPHFKRPDKPQVGELVQLDSIPLSTRPGFYRSITYRDFVRDRMWSVTLWYLVLDFCSVFMMKDPYFIFGPETTYPLPPYLAVLPPWLLEVSRSALALAGVMGALFMILGFDQIFRCVVLGTRVWGVRGDLWHYPSLYGSFTGVLDKGLAGFWGSWWHQSFRIAFAAPTRWLVQQGYLSQDPRALSTLVIGLFIAFLQSGLLHGMGGVSAVADTTKPWQPPIFFLLSSVGIVVQRGFCMALKTPIQQLPRWTRRVGNLVFVGLWLHFTRWALVDDMCRGGLWLFEPVPISPLRAFGFGRPGDSWWRWNQDQFLFWHTGEHWWDSGLGI